MAPQLRDTWLSAKQSVIRLPIYEPRLICGSRPLLLTQSADQGCPGRASRHGPGFWDFRVPTEFRTFIEGVLNQVLPFGPKRPGVRVYATEHVVRPSRPLWIHSLLTSAGADTSYFQVVVLRVQYSRTSLDPIVHISWTTHPRLLRGHSH